MKTGKYNIRWSQSRCGYVIFKGRNFTNYPSFDTEEKAREFIDNEVKKWI